MKKLMFAPLLFAVFLVGACSDATAPVPENARKADPSLLLTLPSDRGIVVPNDGSIVTVTPEMVNTGGQKGHFAMSCTSLYASRRCALLWVMAGTVTTLSIATCMTGVVEACIGAVITTAYSWDQYYQEPDCRTCNTPFNLRVYDQWYRRDLTANGYIP